MKAFVIKFNNDYYWCGYNNSDKQLRKAVLYKSIKMAEETAKDCMSRIEYIRPYTNKIESYKIIEITITEGNLDKEIERLKQENNKPAFALAEEPDKDELLQLKQDFDILYNKTKERDASIRKQVCDEIKREMENLENIELSSYMTLCDIIDKIEQGEQE